MKTTITIHLGGMNFTLDPDAHKLLERYLTAVRKNLDSSDNADEIMEDIEARIAELFNDELNKTHTGIITVQQVERIISIMGTPESYEDGQHKVESEAPATHHLYRDTEGGLLAGVCSGFAYYCGIDAVWVRLLLLLVTIFGYGWPVLLYIVMWIIVPKAETPAQKMEMHGKPVTIDSLKSNIEHATDEFKQNDSPGIKIIKVLLKIFIGIFAIAAILCVILVLASVILSLLGVTTILTGFCLDPGSDWQTTAQIVSGVLLVACPAFLVVGGVISLLKNRRWSSKGYNWAFVVVWLLAAAVFCAATYIKHPLQSDRQGCELTVGQTTYEAIRTDEQGCVFDRDSNAVMLQDFNRIVIEGHAEVQLTRNDRCGIFKRESDGVTRMNLEDGTLTIRISKGKADFNLMLPSLAELNVNGGARVYSDDFWSGEQLKITANGASDITLRPQFDWMQVTSNGAGEIAFPEGEVGDARYTLNGSSELNAANCMNHRAEITLNGANTADLWVENDLKITGHGASTVKYKGDPSVSTDTKGACQIYKME